MDAADTPSGPGRFVGSPSPHEVAGYADAVRAGITPQVSRPDPPRVTVSPTAHAALRQVLVVTGAAVVAIVVTMVVGGRGGALGGRALLALLLVSVVGVGGIALAVRRFGRVQLAELARGYTTAEYRLGRWWARSAPDGPRTVGWVQWDWSGTWVLRADGEVVSAPSTDAEPPGLYPSPRRAGAVELWTGHQWSGYLLDGPPRG